MTDEQIGGRFEPASIPQDEVDKLRKDLLDKWEANHPLLRESFPAKSLEEAGRLIDEHLASSHGYPIVMNSRYQVQVRVMPPIDNALPMTWLSIKRRDRQPIHDWRELQEIKNRIVGPECEAVELYPAESRVVDTANQYHLWCFTAPGYKLPFGFIGSSVRSDDSIGGSTNRPFKTHE